MTIDYKSEYMTLLNQDRIREIQLTESSPLDSGQWDNMSVVDVIDDLIKTVGFPVDKKEKEIITILDDLKDWLMVIRREGDKDGWDAIKSQISTHLD